jgi:hypothetical protein
MKYEIKLQAINSDTTERYIKQPRVRKNSANAKKILPHDMKYLNCAIFISMVLNYPIIS